MLCIMVESTMTQQDDSTIWRYMNFAKYVSLLSKGLFFSRPDALGDDWEGTWSFKDVSRFREENKHLSVEQLNRKWSLKWHNKKQSILQIGISCWHRSNCESAALWQIYMPRRLGVAVQSTPQRVVNSVRDTSRSLITRDVDYVNFDSAELCDDPIILLSRKRLEFAHEKELRFVLRFSDEEQLAIKCWSDIEADRQTRHATAGEIKPLIRSGVRCPPEEVLLRSASAGVSLDTDPRTLVEKVYLAPKATAYFRRAVRTVNELHGLPTETISEPTIDNIPFDRIKFHDPTPQWNPDDS